MGVLALAPCWAFLGFSYGARTKTFGTAKSLPRIRSRSETVSAVSHIVVLGQIGNLRTADRAIAATIQTAFSGLNAGDGPTISFEIGNCAFNEERGTEVLPIQSAQPRDGTCDTGQQLLSLGCRQQSHELRVSENCVLLAGSRHDPPSLRVIEVEHSAVLFAQRQR